MTIKSNVRMMIDNLKPGFSVTSPEKMKAKLIEKEDSYLGFFKIIKYKVQHSLFKGGESGDVVRELFVRPNAVAVLLHDPVLKKVGLVKQFRIGALDSDNPWLTELVAGIVEPGESEVDVARREALEETGVDLTGEISKIAEYYNSAGGSNEKTSVFYAQTDLSDAGGVHGLDSENEDILVIVQDEADFVSDVDNAVINNGSALIAGLWLKNRASE